MHLPLTPATRGSSSLGPIAPILAWLTLAFTGGCGWSNITVTASAQLITLIIFLGFRSSSTRPFAFTRPADISFWSAACGGAVVLLITSTTYGRVLTIGLLCLALLAHESIGNHQRRQEEARSIERDVEEHRQQYENTTDSGGSP